jgi:hypothetical protein
MNLPASSPQVRRGDRTRRASPRRRHTRMTYPFTRVSEVAAPRLWVVGYSQMDRTPFDCGGPHHHMGAPAPLIGGLSRRFGGWGVSYWVPRFSGERKNRGYTAREARRSQRWAPRCECQPIVAPELPGSSPRKVVTAPRHTPVDGIGDRAISR